MDAGNFLIGMIVAFSRIASFLFMIPFLKGRYIPRIAKITVALSLSLVVAKDVGQLPIKTLPELLSIVLIQIIIGLTLAYIVEAIFMASQMAGSLIDYDMGYSQATLLDPSSGQHVTILSYIFYSLFVIVFLSVGGVEFLISGIMYSFQFTTNEFFLGDVSFIEMIIGVFMYMFTAAIQIALPLTASMFIVNFVLLILGKTAPQINILMNMFAIKIAIGILFLYVTLPFVAELFTQINEVMMDKYLEAMNTMFKK